MSQLYFIYNENNNAVKIGLAVDIHRRLATIQGQNASRLSCIKVIEDCGKKDETEFHLRFKESHIHGEWFQLTGELGKYLQDSLEDIPSHINTDIPSNTIIKANKAAEEREVSLNLMRTQSNIKKTDLSNKRSAAGYLGGISTLERYGREQMRDWGAMGGRPRSLTLAELESQFSAPDSLYIERRNRLPGVVSSQKPRGASNLKIKEGELAGAVLSGSPEGDKCHSHYSVKSSM